MSECTIHVMLPGWYQQGQYDKGNEGVDVFVTLYRERHGATLHSGRILRMPTGLACRFHSISSYDIFFFLWQHITAGPMDNVSYIP
jgi:hypothetical protein